MDSCAMFCFIICLILSLMFLLLLLSMDTIEPLEYGITYNKITKTIGPDVYENGRYILLPWKSFIRYPSNLVTVEFSDSRRSVVYINLN